MKTIFIKSGGYYETPGIAISGAIHDHYDFDVNQFHKTDMSFKLDCQNGEFRLYLAHHQPSITAAWRVVDMALLTRKAEEFGFAYFGMISDDRAVISHMEMLNNLGVVTIDGKSGQFISGETSKPLDGNNIMPALYCVKMADNTYAVVLSGLTRIDSYLSSNNDGVPMVLGDVTYVVVNDGAAMRDQFVDLKFTNAKKHFRNNDLVTGFALFIERGKEVKVDVFRDMPFVNDDFKKSFMVSVDSSIGAVAQQAVGTVTIPAQAEKGVGYMSITLKSTELYREVASREIKEMLTIDLIVSVL